MQGPYIPLREGSKAPAVSGWADPDYEGIEPSGRVGQRCDGIVVIDCDSEDAATAWAERGVADATRVHQTPRGYHFIYRWTPGSPEGPAVGVLDGIDVRAGRGSYIVVPPTEGYTIVGDWDPAPFDPAWLPTKVERKDKLTAEVVEHDGLVPEGARSDYLTSFAGRLREAGHTTEQIARLLARANETLFETPLDRQELVNLLGQVDRWHQGEKPLPEIRLSEDEDAASPERLLSAKSMEPPDPPVWWWEPYIPGDRLVMLDGAEGIGKGMMSAWLAAHVTAGVDPDGAGGDVRNVLWLSAEDDPRDDVLRRLLAQDWTHEHGDVLFWNLGRYWPRFPKDTAMLVETIRESNIGMVVLDPGRSFLGPPEEMDRRDFSFNDEASVRPGMEALGRVAKETACSVVFVHHHNKRSKRDASTRERMGGSIAFLQVVRHRVTLSEVKDGRKAFAVEKSNIAPSDHTVFEYGLVPAEVEHTVRFQLERHRPEFLTLGEWEQSEEEVPLDRSEAVIRAIEACDERTVLPGPRRLQEAAEALHGAPVSSREVKAVYDALVAHSVLSYKAGRGYVVGPDWSRRWDLDPKALQ